jgi:osmoprotectant transport system ATP-binding protein
MIVLDHLTKSYGPGPAAVDNLTLEVVSGEVCVLIGPSGCGKSTTLRMVNRLIEPTSGRIWLDGEDVTSVDPVELRRRVGYVIQHVGLFPHLTVRDNVATVPRLLGWDKARIRDRVDDLLDLVGLDHSRYGRRWPHELSGGQRQRVGFARALGADPPVLLMDEPFGAIDPITRHRLQEEFSNLQQRLRKTVVLVTHDLDEAVRLGDRIALLAQGGHLEQYATPGELLGAPATDFVAEFVGTDRSLRRLAVVTLKASDTDPIPASGVTSLPSVRLGGSLRDALVGVLDSPSGRALVVDDGGTPRGTIAAAGILAASHRSLVSFPPSVTGEDAP